MMLQSRQMTASQRPVLSTKSLSGHVVRQVYRGTSKNFGMSRVGSVGVQRRTVTKATPKFLDKESGPEALHDLDCVIFDCDGVIWSGFNPIPNAIESLLELKKKGLRLLFVSNNASKSRQGYVERFKSLGIEVGFDEVVPASYAAAAYLQDVNFKATGKKVLLLANKGCEEELQLADIPYIGGEKWKAPVMDTADKIKQLTVDPEIGAVVVGWDPYLDYNRIVYAATCIRENWGCEFIATNLDPVDNLGKVDVQPDGAFENGTDIPIRRLMPVTGTMVGALEPPAGRKPIVTGKGGPWLFPFLTKYFNLDPARTAIVGDRLDTDIAVGAEGGLRTILPFTGVTTPRDLDEAIRVSDQPGAMPVPDYVIPTMSALAKM